MRVILFLLVIVLSGCAGNTHYQPAYYHPVPAWQPVHYQLQMPPPIQMYEIPLNQPLQIQLR